VLSAVLELSLLLLLVWAAVTGYKTNRAARG
jgi:hypothetical protein